MKSKREFFVKSSLEISNVEYLQRHNLNGRIDRDTNKTVIRHACKQHIIVKGLHAKGVSIQRSKHNNFFTNFRDAKLLQRWKKEVMNWF